MNAPKIPATDEAWDEGELGRDNAFVRKAGDNIEAQIDDALELQMISVRLQRSLIDDLKSIATINGIGYQPLMRQILKRFVDGEKKKILMDRVAEQIRTKTLASEGLLNAASVPTKATGKSRKKAA